ncbi:MAG: cbb3-type cytochrome c oxidase subunit II [Halofilum sp. (in: g-proteobacteria)]|nr:cbb3-type cytochrome c oxidase subunit II [Halofilum sp. (in: g-proteobacteria)]
MSFHRNHWLLFGTIFFGFIALAIVIAIAPAYWVQVQTRANQDVEPLSKQEQRGLGVYVSEGCVACHTQQVRPLEMDSTWGRPSARRDYANLGGAMEWWRPYAPAVLGSSRIGPDLSNIGNRQPSEVWHYLHLYNPRAVVEDSIMPAYPWLFDVTENPDEDATVVSVPEPYGPDEGKVVPSPRGEALVSYLLSLQQPHVQGSSGRRRRRQEPGGDSVASKTGRNSRRIVQRMVRRWGTPVQPALRQLPPGQRPGRAGNVSRSLADNRGRDRAGSQNSTSRRFSRVPRAGRLMARPIRHPCLPLRISWSDAEIAAIVNHERTSWGNDAPTVTGRGCGPRSRNGGVSDAVTADSPSLMLAPLIPAGRPLAASWRSEAPDPRCSW